MVASSFLKRLSAAALLLCSAGLVSAGPLGELEIVGDVRLTQMGSAETITLRNTTYTVFAGDRVATGSSPASLRLSAGDSLAIGPNSELTLNQDAGLLRAELSRGSLAYLLNGSAETLKVNGDTRLAAGRLGMLEVADNGSLRRIEGVDAERMAAASGLLVSRNRIDVACKDPNGCDAVRPKSISP